MSTAHTIIIGGSKGIGKATSLRFSASDHTVSVLSTSSDSLELSNNLQFFQTDIVETKQLKKNLELSLEKFGPVTNLVFCQRYRGEGDDWEGELNTSLSGTKECIDFLIPHFSTERANSIVIISSILGDFIARNTPLSYHVCKAGLIQLSKYYAVQLAPKNIRVNSISPGTILKPESKDFYLNTKNIHDLYTKINLNGEMGTDEDIAGIIHFLCSADAKLINGQNLVVDGGLSLQWQETLSKELYL